MVQALVLLPGLNNTADVFADVVAALPAGVDVHSPTLPALDSVDAIAAALLSTLPERFWLAGFSFGGYVALAMLAAAPQRVAGIALLCSAPAADTAEQSAARERSIAAAATGDYEALIERQAPMALHPDSLNNDSLLARRRAMVRDYGAARFIAHQRASIQRIDRSHLLDGGRPTLVLAASHDRVFAPAELQALAPRVPGARYSLVAEAGHLAPLEQPVAVAHALAAWLAS